MNRIKQKYHVKKKCEERDIHILKLSNIKFQQTFSYRVKRYMHIKC